MRIGYLDCFSGVAGDMWVGALVDLGLSLPEIAPAVRSLDLPGVGIRSERVLRAGIAGTRFLVDVAPRGGGHGPHRHRHLEDVEAILQRADLPDVVRDDCLGVFSAIAAAEGRAHDLPPDRVHFHEVGAEDTIVDVVCACLGTHLLGLERLYASVVAVGSGTVRCEHGVLPVPAPGALDLLFGVPVRSGTLQGERTTPTGAALLRVLVDEFEPDVTWVPERRGHGAGARDDPDHPNLLRLTVGEQRDPGAAGALRELCCNLDTATGETVGWMLDELLQRGAADAFAAAVQGKKGRPGWIVTALCDEARAEAVERFLLEESSSLGVRSHRVRRAVLERWQETVTTEFGPVRFKAARLPSGTVVRRPEDDELRRLGQEQGLGRGELLRRLSARHG
jgi:uncharacterized protein (TIGR00299 family) protein